MKVRTVKGNLLDMGELMAKHAFKRAAGNASMNARGDIIDAHGNIVKKREAITMEYNTSNPNAVKQVALRDISKEVFVTPAEAVAQAKAALEASKTVASQSPQRKRQIEDRDD